jgi:CRISPR-associated exonuclease Cas4
MLGQPVPCGAIYRHKSRKRDEVALDEKLRARTLETIEAVRGMLIEQAMPEPPADARCPKCSLLPACMPEALTDGRRQRAHAKGLYEFGEEESACDSG